MTTYISQSWARVCSRSQELDPCFAKHLRDIARPIQIAYTRLMRETDGCPIGIECKSKLHDTWAFVVPEVSDQTYSFRLQSFDRNGFCGHFCHRSLSDAVSELVRGYPVIDRGALDRLCTTDDWKIGVLRSEIRLLFDQKKINFQEYLNRCSEVTL